MNRSAQSPRVVPAGGGHRRRGRPIVASSSRSPSSSKTAMSGLAARDHLLSGRSSTRRPSNQ